MSEHAPKVHIHIKTTWITKLSLMQVFQVIIVIDGVDRACVLKIARNTAEAFQALGIELSTYAELKQELGSDAAIPEVLGWAPTPGGDDVAAIFLEAADCSLEDDIEEHWGTLRDEQGEDAIPTVQRPLYFIPEIWLLMMPLLMTLAALHRLGRLHCDLKPGNILLLLGKALLIDWGASIKAPVKLWAQSMLQGPHGTDGFCLPELSAGGVVAFHHSIDTRPLAVLFVHLLFGLFPEDVHDWFLKGYLDESLPEGETKDLILRSMDTENPDRQPTLDEWVLHGRAVLAAAQERTSTKSVVMLSKRGSIADDQRDDQSPRVSTSVCDMEPRGSARGGMRATSHSVASNGMMLALMPDMSKYQDDSDSDGGTPRAAPDSPAPCVPCTPPPQLRSTLSCEVQNGADCPAAMDHHGSVAMQRNPYYASSLGDCQSSISPDVASSLRQPLLRFGERGHLTHLGNALIDTHGAHQTDETMGPVCKAVAARRSSGNAAADDESPLAGQVCTGSGVSGVQCSIKAPELCAQASEPMTLAHECSIPESDQTRAKGRWGWGTVKRIFRGRRFCFSASQCIDQ